MTLAEQRRGLTKAIESGLETIITSALTARRAFEAGATTLATCEGGADIAADVEFVSERLAAVVEILRTTQAELKRRSKSA